jgi:hypothetical protein
VRQLLLSPLPLLLAILVFSCFSYRSFAEKWWAKVVRTLAVGLFCLTLVCILLWCRGKAEEGGRRSREHDAEMRDAHSGSDSEIRRRN